LVKYGAFGKKNDRPALFRKGGEESPDSIKQGTERKLRRASAGVPSTEREKGWVLNWQDSRATVTIRS